MLTTIVTPVYRTPMTYMRVMSASVAEALSVPEADSFIARWIVVLDGDERDLGSLLRTLPVRVRERTSLLRLNRNEGLAAAKNHGARLCESPYLTWLDADDALVPHAYIEFLRAGIQMLSEQARCVAAFSDNWECDADLVRRYIRRKGPPIELHRKFRGTALDPALFVDLTYHAQLLRQSDFHRVGGFREGEIGEDVHLTMKLLRTGRATHLGHVDHVPYLYRRNPTGITETQTAELRHLNTQDFRRFQREAGLEDWERAQHRISHVQVTDKSVKFLSPRDDDCSFNTYLPLGVQDVVLP